PPRRLPRPTPTSSSSRKAARTTPPSRRCWPLCRARTSRTTLTRPTTARSWRCSKPAACGRNHTTPGGAAACGAWPGGAAQRPCGTGKEETPMIELQHLTKRFASTSGGTVVALKDINLTIRDGDIYGIIGMSGAGKSTLVRCINMLERPDEGSVLVNGKAMQQLSAAELRAARREITMIFQQFNLLM